jgi:catechol 2,3-dioxygenase-like lactoylglutathione lyase family enzyme
MPSRTPLWPAQLDHFRIDTDNPPPLIAFYERALGMAATELDDGTVLMQAPGRRLLIGPGVRGAQPFVAFKVQSDDQLDALRRRVVDRGLKPLPNPSAVFGKGAFAVRDPDGRLALFGRPQPHLSGTTPARHLGAANLPGRLQHVVVASKELPAMLRFYEHDLGFVVSDYVLENGEPTVGFFRSDPEHHSFAVFQSAQTCPDHHAYETTCWNDIRDWADHLATLDIKLWWGPGRHGPGNNLFFMVKDPQDYLVEISAELEIMPDEVTKRTWKHEERTLNLWGSAFMRS